MNHHTKAEVRRRAADRGFDSPEAWRKENRYWSKEFHKRKKTRELAKALDVEFAEWLEGYEGLRP